SDLAVAILRDSGGSAADAAVAAALCVGLINAHSSGVGGGGVAVVYSTADANAAADEPGIVYDFREVAPAAATRDMFVADPQLAQTGALAVATPGEVAGLERLHSAHGRLPWADVVLPVAGLAEGGFRVGPALAEA